MRHFGGFGLALFCAAGLFGQGFGGRNPVASSGFGQVFSPARRSISGLPGGGHARATTGTTAYAYPVYVGSYGYLGGYADAYGQDAYPPDYGTDGAPPPAAAPSQPNVTVIYPPQQTTVIINSSPDGGTPSVSVLQGPPPGYPPPPMARRAPAPDTSSNASSDNEDNVPHYLIALKDHTIYNAVAYWVDGDTLHYFTTPSTHNQVSLALVDRDLTQRLNQESGIDLKLPPAPAAAH
jgi:hypothetical protein